MSMGPNEWKVKLIQSFLAIFGLFSCCRRLYILWFSFLWSVLDEESVDSEVLVNKLNSEKEPFIAVKREQYRLFRTVFSLWIFQSYGASSVCQ